MGLDANVMCNCFRDGKATPPPFPKDWLEYDAEGYLNLKVEHETYELYRKYRKWEQSCCDHENLLHASERISNWTGCRLFQEAIGKVGWELFPTLIEQLPNANGGSVPSEASAKALLELDVFEAAGVIGSKTVLVDTATGENLYEYVAPYDGVFILNGGCGIDVGLSESEFFARDRRSQSEVFRAVRVKQYRKSGMELSACDDDVVWKDLETGRIYESGLAIEGKCIPWDDGNWKNSEDRYRHEYPSEFHVEQQPQTVADFERIVQALRTVFAASVETGNPVRWC